MTVMDLDPDVRKLLLALERIRLDDEDRAA